MRIQKGATLIEVVLSMVILSAVIGMGMMIFPKIAQSITKNRRQWLASNLVSTRIQELKGQPYNMIPLTTLPAPCDCKAVNMATLADDMPEMVENSVRFTRKVCTALVDRQGTAWVSACDDNTAATDRGFKYIRVMVLWTVGNETFSTQSETMATRYAN